MTTTDTGLVRNVLAVLLFAILTAATGPLLVVVISLIAGAPAEGA